MKPPRANQVVKSLELVPYADKAPKREEFFRADKSPYRLDPPRQARCAAPLAVHLEDTRREPDTPLLVPWFHTTGPDTPQKSSQTWPPLMGDKEELMLRRRPTHYAH